MARRHPLTFDDLLSDARAVAALLMRKGVRCELDSVGLPDAFLLAGALPTLHDRYGISTAKVAESLKAWLA